MGRHQTEAAAPEIWRDIPGYGGRYQASTEGRIRKIWPVSGKKTICTPYRRQRRKQANSDALRVHISLPDGRRVERTVINLVAETFLGSVPGRCAVHKNGMSADNSLSNIALMTNSQIGKTFGAQAKRRPVVKIDETGEIIACYPSARAAASENYVSHQTVADRCNRRVKKEFALDGFSYRWDDTAW